MKPTLRCSELDRRLWCPGALTLESRVAPRQGEEGDEGTWLHYLIAKRLIDELGAVGPEGGLKAPTCPRPKSLQFSMWIVAWAVRHVKETIPADWSLEVEIGWGYEWDNFILSGHPDVLAVSPDGLQIKLKDWKCGYDPVDPAESNEQALGHVVLAKRAYPDAQSVEFEMCQPRNDEEEGHERVSGVTVANTTIPVKDCRVTPPKEWDEPYRVLDALPLGFENRVNAALAKPMSLSTGKGCRFCAASSQCFAIIKLRKKMKHEMTAEELATITATPNDAVLGEWIVDAKTLAQPIKDATELLHSRLDSVPSITSASGVHITRKIQRGAYEVEDPPAFYRELSALIPDPTKRALALRFSMTAIKDTISEVLNIPKTGKAAVTAEGVFDAKLRLFTKQGERRLIQFS